MDSGPCLLGEVLLLGDGVEGDADPEHGRVRRSHCTANLWRVVVAIGGSDECRIAWLDVLMCLL